MHVLALALCAASFFAACSGAGIGPTPTACWGDLDGVTPGTVTGVLRANPRDPYLASTWLVRGDGQGVDIGWPPGFTEETGRAPERHHRVFVPPVEAEVVFAEEGDIVRLTGGQHVGGSFIVCVADGPNGRWPGLGSSAVPVSAAPQSGDIPAR